MDTEEYGQYWEAWSLCYWDQRASTPQPSLAKHSMEMNTGLMSEYD